jgi:hypothetical protein
MSDHDPQSTARSWASAASDVLAVALAGCRSLKDMLGTGARPVTFPVTLDPTCQQVWRAPGVVQVKVRRREQEDVALHYPVRVRQAVPNTVPLLGPHAATSPQSIAAGQDHVQVSISTQLLVGLYLGRVDDAQGAGTPFVIYLDGLP